MNSRGAERVMWAKGLNGMRARAACRRAVADERNVAEADNQIPAKALDSGGVPRGCKTCGVGGCAWQMAFTSGPCGKHNAWDFRGKLRFRRQLASFEIRDTRVLRLGSLIQQVGEVVGCGCRRGGTEELPSHALR